jgi:hypothetical protein
MFVAVRQTSSIRQLTADQSHYFLAVVFHDGCGQP